MRNLLFTLMLLLTLSGYAQSVFIQQDAKLLMIGDERGNSAGTSDFVLGFEYPLYEQKYTIGLQTEYSNLVGGLYKRHSLFLGYNKDNLVFPGVRFSTYLNYGMIQRYGVNYGSIGGNLELSVRIIKRLRVLASEQYTHRTELKKIYKTNDFHRFSFFIGLKYDLHE
jgi:hypothetical protein